jgi:hypothetical protein
MMSLRTSYTVPHTTEKRANPKKKFDPETPGVPESQGRGESWVAVAEKKTSPTRLCKHSTAHLRLTEHPTHVNFFHYISVILVNCNFPFMEWMDGGGGV